MSYVEVNQHLLMQYRRFVKVVILEDIPDDGINSGYPGWWNTSTMHPTYGDICHPYTEYVARKYKDAIVAMKI